MATVTRINGSKTQVGVVYNNNCNLYLITVLHANASAVDLTAEDSYGANAITGGTVEAIVEELCPLAYFTSADTTGRIHVVMDLSRDSAAELQYRIRNIGLVAGSTLTSIGPNGVDISGSTVVAASSFIVA